LAFDAPDDFSLRKPEESLQLRQQAAETMGLMLAAIASVALIVGGVGVLNIMLVSVVERTREIGLRVALGAREWDVRSQFLIEAVTLTAAGGVFGMVLGMAGAEALTQLSDWQLSVSWESMLAAVVAAGAVGIVFGYYPAHRASRLDPIDALRFE
jgi:putative ABC transport system permease protein